MRIFIPSLLTIQIDLPDSPGHVRMSRCYHFTNQVTMLDEGNSRRDEEAVASLLKARHLAETRVMRLLKPHHSLICFKYNMRVRNRS